MRGESIRRDPLKVLVTSTQEQFRSCSFTTAELLRSQTRHFASAYISGCASPTLADKVIDEKIFRRKKNSKFYNKCLCQVQVSTK